MFKKKRKTEESPQSNEAITDQKAPTDATQAGKAPLLSHLLALRHVLIVSFIAVAVAFFLVFYLCIDPLMAWITEPIASRGISIIYTAMSEALVTKFKVALIAACILASPVIIYEVWRFIERQLILFGSFVEDELFVSGRLCFLISYPAETDKAIEHVILTDLSQIHVADW